jgi:hypothetical protein
MTRKMILIIMLASLLVMGLIFYWVFDARTIARLKEALSGGQLAWLPWVLLAVAIVTLSPLALWIFSGPSKQEQRLLVEGIPAAARVLTVTDTKLTLNKDPILELELEVLPNDAAAYTATVKGPISRVAFPRVGDRVTVRYDPQDPQRLLLERP